ncbi:MAG: cation:dicarboxylase symporter family transporter [Candidatus Altiarchaeales archaeon]|nr:cation:dicarboxylase symporter family transporter [Candidatus Altiarchaeales archaeon]MBD3416475.1 cation:dicarboxylase symporter family transporter [Candidatus Altiarchaeales archaeon]
MFPGLANGAGSILPEVSSSVILCQRQVLACQRRKLPPRSFAFSLCDSQHLYVCLLFSPTVALELLYPKPLKRLNSHLQDLVAGRLWLKILLGMVTGLLAGLVLGPSAGLVEPSTASIVGDWLAVPGQVFLGLLKMIVVPLVFASIIGGIASSENLEQLRKVGLMLLVFVVVTTSYAIAVGVALAYVVEPGEYVTAPETASEPESSENPQQALDLGNLPKAIGSLVPANPLNSMVETEMLQVVLFAMVIGLAVISIPVEQAKPILELIASLQQVCIQIVKWAMVLAPVAVFGLMAKLTTQLGLDALLGMAVYVGTVLAGLLLLLTTYTLISFAAARISPLTFLTRTRELLLLAFSTSSSAAVMPLSIKTAEEKLGVRKSLSQFIIPLGATVNMAGTALYQGVAAVFLAQVFDVQLGISQILLIIATVVGSSIGSPATPGMGIVILSIVLTSVGIPAVGVALILGVDRILDMARTSVNVTGDLTACLVMEKLMKKENAS